MALYRVALHSTGNSLLSTGGPTAIPGKPPRPALDQVLGSIRALLAAEYRRGADDATHRIIQAATGNGSVMVATPSRAADIELCRRRADALLEALGEGEMAVPDLMAAVRDHPAWLGCGDNAKLNQLVRDRLNAMLAKGRILDRHERGGRLRFVRRTP